MSSSLARSKRHASDPICPCADPTLSSEPGNSRSEQSAKQKYSQPDSDKPGQVVERFFGFTERFLTPGCFKIDLIDRYTLLPLTYSQSFDSRAKFLLVRFHALLRVQLSAVAWTNLFRLLRLGLALEVNSNTNLKTQE